MEKGLILAAETRAKEEKMSQLKKEGFAPAVLYGPSSGNVALKIKLPELKKVFSAAGESNLFDLTVDGKPAVKALFKSVDKEVMKNQIIHADIYQVDMSKKVTTDVQLHFVGESKAIKDFGGTLVKAISHIEIECLPSDLIDHVDVDLSVLTSLGDSIFVKDLRLPTTSKVIGLHDNDMIVSAVETDAEEAAPAAVAPAAPAKAEKKGK